jgi:hypothetical protein
MTAVLGDYLPGSGEGFVISADGAELAYIEAAYAGRVLPAADSGWRVDKRTYDVLREMASSGSNTDTVDNVRVTPGNPTQLAYLEARSPGAPTGTSSLSRSDGAMTDSNGTPLAWHDSSGHGDRYGVTETEDRYGTPQLPSNTWWLRRSELAGFEALA